MDILNLRSKKNPDFFLALNCFAGAGFREGMGFSLEVLMAEVVK